MVVENTTTGNTSEVREILCSGAHFDDRGRRSRNSTKSAIFKEYNYNLREALLLQHIEH